MMACYEIRYLAFLIIHYAISQPGHTLIIKDFLVQTNHSNTPRWFQ